MESNIKAKAKAISQSIQPEQKLRYAVHKSPTGYANNCILIAFA